LKRAIATLRRLGPLRGIIVHEADVSAESTPTEEDAWLPRAHEDEGRAKSAEAEAREGAETAHSVTGRLRRLERLTRGAEFQALFQQGKRIERPSMIVLWRASEEPRRVGFAVARQIHGAVQRNRVRRRLREAYRVARDAAPPKVDLVVIGRSAALGADASVLVADMRGAFQAMALPRGSR
jgi:ribonuclease P protein component